MSIVPRAGFNPPLLFIYVWLMADCIFCKIISGALSASVVYRDELVLAFMDTNPVTSGHVLIVPFTHAPYLPDMPEETGAQMFRVAMRLQDAIRRSGLRCEGINLFLADGEAAFQEIFHVHLHVFPRYKDDNFRIDADWSTHPSRAELDAVA